MNRTYRLDRANSRIMGVCAGLARRFGWDTTLVRVAAVLGLFFLGPVMLAAYLLTGWLAE
jgi:phage shock protein PspC (stress-responsive transcriptional regulator)